MTVFADRALRLPLCLLACLLVAAPAAALDRGATARGKPVTLAGVTYLPRWNSATQFEYTPTGQEDLKRWSEMITFVDVPGLTSSGRLIQYRDALRANSSKDGAVLGEQCVPSDEAPRECWLSTALKGDGFVETTISRITTVNGAGLVAIFAHREYGPQAADKATAWLRSPAARKTNAAWLAWPLSSRPR